VTVCNLGDKRHAPENIEYLAVFEDEKTVHVGKENHEHGYREKIRRKYPEGPLDEKSFEAELAVAAFTYNLPAYEKTAKGEKEVNAVPAP